MHLIQRSITFHRTYIQSPQKSIQVKAAERLTPQQTDELGNRSLPSESLHRHRNLAARCGSWNTSIRPGQVAVATWYVYFNSPYRLMSTSTHLCGAHETRPTHPPPPPRSRYHPPPPLSQTRTSTSPLQMPARISTHHLSALYLHPRAHMTARHGCCTASPT